MLQYNKMKLCYVTERSETRKEKRKKEDSLVVLLSHDYGVISFNLHAA
jgi:hypothetical protein